MTKLNNFTDEEFETPKARNFAHAWAQKIDEEHCNVTLGDYDINGPEVQKRVATMEAAAKSVEFFGGEMPNIFNENMAIQLIFCITYRGAFFFQNLK